MPEAWSSKYDRERAHEKTRIEQEQEGVTDREAKEEAADMFTTETDEPRGRRVAD